MKVIDYDKMYIESGIDAVTESISDQCTEWLEYVTRNDRGALEK